MMVKYEDIVQNPKAMAVKLYDFLNATQSLQHAFNYLESHLTQPKVAHKLAKVALKLSLAKRKIRLDTQWRTGQLSRLEFEKARQNDSYVPLPDQQEREKRLHQYYGTYREYNFAHDHWRQELPPDVLRDIHNNTVCQKVLKRFSYKL